MRKLIVAGGRKFQDYDYLVSCMHIATRGEKVQIVSGNARGADQMGEMYAKEFGHDVIIFKADWKKYGRSAGPIRNEQMGDYGTELCAFWDGRSTGTKSMIKYARKLGLEVRVYNYDE